MHLFAIASTKLQLMPFDVQLLKSCYYTMQATIHAPCRPLIAARSQRRKAIQVKYFARNLKSMAILEACKPGSKITWNHGGLPEWQLAKCKVCKHREKHFQIMHHFCITPVKQIKLCVQSIKSSCQTITRATLMPCDPPRFARLHD